MSAHTPGPWGLETVKTQIGICHCIGPFPPLRPGGKPSHACIYVDGRYRAEDHAESLANARLIAAAPELLEVLGEMVEMMDTDNEPGHGSHWHKKAKAAIAKAKGQP